MKLYASIRKILCVALPTLGLIFSANKAFANDIYVVQNSGGKCLDVQNALVSTERQIAWIWDCYENYYAQKFILVPRVNHYVIKNTGGLCLDLSNNLNQNGVLVWFANCYDNSDSQKWRIFDWGDGTSGIRNVQNGNNARCLDVAGGRVNYVGTHLHVWNCEKSPQQRWIFWRTGSTNTLQKK